MSLQAHAPFTDTTVSYFLGGFMTQITGQNHLEEIIGCYEQGELMKQEVAKAAEYMAEAGGKLDEGQAYLEYGIVVMQIPIALHSCLDIGDDVKSIENWAGIFVHPKKLVETVGKNVLVNRKELTTLFGSVKEDWATGKWF
jgi:hypothetical protein